MSGWIWVWALTIGCGEDCPDIPRYADADRDGFGDRERPVDGCDEPAVTDASDCDDADPAVFVGAVDGCDGVDSDCDGEIDEDADLIERFFDADRDGYGSRERWVGCTFPPPLFTASVSGDCDDVDPAIGPGSEERCNGIDDDCDEQIDEAAVDAVQLYVDDDLDGFGGRASPAGCPEAGLTPVAGDCDDRFATVYPGAPERCDGRDNDCDLDVDEDGIGAAWYYFDGDRDGFGGAGEALCPILVTLDHVQLGGDCDDDDPLVNPFEVEVCGGFDDNCNGLIDDEDPALNRATTSSWARDADGDGWGDAADEIRACAPPAGFVLRVGDCDDDDDAVSPEADEVCNTVDDDCDDQIDESGVCP